MARGVFDSQSHRTAWSALDWRTRRRIVRAVNRGLALENRREARLAIGVARGQQRFWRWAWLVGPLAALFVLREGIVVYVVNAAVATSVLGLMSWFWYSRARRAEVHNLEVATRGRRRRSGDAPSRGDPRSNGQRSRRGGSGRRQGRGRRRPRGGDGKGRGKRR